MLTLFENILGGVEHLDIPVIHHQHAVSHPRDILHGMRHQQHRAARLFAVFLDAAENLVPASRVKSRRRFVQNQHLRLHGNHARNRRPTLFAARQIEGRLFQKRFLQPRKFGGGADDAIQLVLAFDALVHRAERDIPVHRFFK